MLSLTPALGWNSWNARGRSVTEELVRRTADAFVDKGLVDHGWTYICIDDGWERSPRESDALYEGPTRDENGNFIPNKKFPDMKALGDYIHSKGLKFGIYSSPGPTTCQGLEGSFQHEEQDVMQWCSWGVDYLKYDWCSYRATEEGLPGMKKPYQLMRAILNKAPRDIVFSICQYGNGNVWEWGAEPDVGGNSWRTTGDIRDNWPQTMQIGFNPRWTEIDIGQYSGPGHWNDVDMLVVGVVGWSYEPQHESKLTPAEQLSHISLWTLHAAPLILGCDLAQGDDFTVSLLTNDEVLDIDQDLMGRGAKAVYRSPNSNLQVWSRPLADGSKAVGLFNLEEMPSRVTARWSDLGINGSHAVRDVWRQKDLGRIADEFSAEIPRHGCMLLRISNQ
jgi:alpha-galactosidase